MIQRIQSIYLLLVTALLVAAISLPLGTFVTGDLITSYSFSPLGVELTEEMHYTWGLLALLLLSTLISTCTIFLFRNRVLQIRMSIFNAVLLIGYYIAFVVFMLMLQHDLQMTFHIEWSLCLPLIAIIFDYLAIRAIGRDEVMVKAADRLR